MAVDPHAPVVRSGKRFFDNEATTLLQLEDPRAYLIQSASRIVRDCPPALPWPSPFRGQVFRGLFAGPTSIAYFFWTLSTKHPDLEIEGKKPSDWCKAYLREYNLSQSFFFQIVSKVSRHLSPPKFLFLLNRSKGLMD